MPRPTAALLALAMMTPGVACGEEPDASAPAPASAGAADGQVGVARPSVRGRIRSPDGDSLFSTVKTVAPTALLFARRGDEPSWIPVANADEFPDDTSLWVNVRYSTKDHTLVTVDTGPVSESGDSYQADTYLFRGDGSLARYRHVDNFFGDACADPVHTTLTVDYLPGGYQSSVFSVTDADGRTLLPKADGMCAFGRFDATPAWRHADEVPIPGRAEAPVASPAPGAGPALQVLAPGSTATTRTLVETLNREIEKGMATLTGCYSDELAARPGASGWARLELVVRPSGRVQVRGAEGYGFAQGSGMLSCVANGFQVERVLPASSADIVLGWYVVEFSPGP